jgi:F-type H+-transporting ATPase subunit alpha
LGEYLLSDNYFNINPAEITRIIKEELKNFNDKLEVENIGNVVKINDGIANVYGLTNAMSGELVKFKNNIFGMVMNLEIDNTGIILLSNDADSIVENDIVKTTGKFIEVPVGDELLGRVVDSLGNPIDEKGKLNKNKLMPIERQAAGIIERREVNRPLQTGIKAIDAMVPIGMGQRELIIGDRQTGKTSLCIDSIINQKDKNVICVYVAIGQKMSTLARTVKKLKDNDAIDYTCVVVSSSSDCAALQYIAPYTGCTIAEEFMSSGKDVLIVYDDLSKHAIAYRTISLLLRRPSGREAFPGDVFYLHSRLLERSVNLLNGGSITALPIIETQSGDISAYIPTNVISITDGQIYLESKLFNSGIRPAINPGLSVSRVGGSAQVKLMKTIASPIRTQLAQYREIESFSQFSSELDFDAHNRLEKGKRLIEVLKQKQYNPMKLEDQIVILYAVTNDFINDLDLKLVSSFEKELLNFLNNEKKELIENIFNSDFNFEELKEIIINIKKKFI